MGVEEGESGRSGESALREGVLFVMDTCLVGELDLEGGRWVGWGGRANRTLTEGTA